MKIIFVNNIFLFFLFFLFFHEVLTVFQLGDDTLVVLGEDFLVLDGDGDVFVFVFGDDVLGEDFLVVLDGVDDDFLFVLDGEDFLVGNDDFLFGDTFIIISLYPNDLIVSAGLTSLPFI